MRQNVWRSVVCVLLASGWLVAAGAEEAQGWPSGVKVSASAFEVAAHGRYAPENTLDGDINSKSSWRADGKGQWIQYDLGAIRPLSAVDIAFHQGEQRTYTIDVLVSPDGETWKTLLVDKVSSGKSADFESFALNGESARYVRIVGKGGSHATFGSWICITEVKIR